MERANLSLCLIFKNERDYISDCFLSVADLCREFILVDSGSTDGSSAWAKELALKDKRVQYFDRAWPGDFSDQRNFAISKAKADWILFLDADERLERSHHQLIRQATVRMGTFACQLEIRNYTSDISEIGFIPRFEFGIHFGFVRTQLHRLFRRDDRIKYEGILHERIEPTLVQYGLKSESLAAVIHHFGKLKEKKGNILKERLQFYAELGIRKVSAHPNDAQAHWELGVIYQKQGQWTEAEREFKKAIDLSPQTEDFEVSYLLVLFQQRAIERLLHHTYRSRRAKFFLALARAEQGAAAIDELPGWKEDFSQAVLLAYEMALRKGTETQQKKLKEAALKEFSNLGIVEWLEGRHFRGKGDYEKAAKLLLKAFDDGYQASLLDLQIALLKLERFSDILRLRSRTDSQLISEESSKLFRLAEVQSKKLRS